MMNKRRTISAAQIAGGVVGALCALCAMCSIALCAAECADVEKAEKRPFQEPERAYEGAIKKSRYR